MKLRFTYNFYALAACSAYINTALRIYRLKIFHLSWNAIELLPTTKMADLQQNLSGYLRNIFNWELNVISMIQ